MEIAEKQNFKPQGDRMRKYIEDYLKITIRQFSLKCGVDKPAKMYNIVDGKGDITYKMERLISGHFPDLNFDWVRTGNGNMINPGYGAQVDDAEEDAEPLDGRTAQGKRLAEFIDSLGISTRKFAMEIGAANAQSIYNLSSNNRYGISRNILLKILAKYPQLNKAWLMEGEGDMLLASAEPEPIDITSETIKEDATPCMMEPVAEFTSNNRSKEKLYEMSEGTKGIVVPFHLESDDVMISSLNLEKQGIESIIRKPFSFFYQVQTDQLFPQLCKNDWMLLETVKDLSTLVDGRVYLLNTVRWKVTCRMFRSRFGILELVDINHEEDVLVLDDISEIREAFEVICALRNNPLIPIHATFYGKEMTRRDKEISTKNKQIDATLDMAKKSIEINSVAIETQRQAIDEIIRSNRRMEELYYKVLSNQ